MQKYIKELRELEDEDVRRAVSENYGFMLRLSHTLSSIDEGWVLLSIFHAIIYNVLVYSYLYLFSITCYLLRDDFVLVGVQFHYLLLALMGAMFQLHMYSRRREFCMTHKIIALDFYSYEDADLLKSYTLGFKKYMIKQRLLLVPFLLLVCMIGMFIAVFGPLIDNMVDAGYDGNYLNGVYMRTPIPMYFPFDVDDIAKHCAVTAFQIITVVMLALNISGVIFVNVVSTQNLAYQFRILIKSLNTLFERSEARYRKLYPNQKIDHNNIISKKFQDCVYSCLKENIKHHQVMRKYYFVQAKLTGFPVLSAFLIGTFILALSMIILVEKTNRIGLLITNTVAMIGEIANLYIACFFGEEILSQSEKLFITTYSLKWYDMNQLNKKLIMLFQDSTRNPMVIKASLIFTCSMDTFSSICNSAYSYFNMLTASASSSKKQD